MLKLSLTFFLLSLDKCQVIIFQYAYTRTEIKDKDTRTKLVNTVITPYYNNIDKSYRSSRPGVFCTNDVLRNFAKFIGKHLCPGLFLFA